MKKNVALKIISIVFVIIAGVAIACAITVTGSGFLDLSNIARAVFIVSAIVFCALAVTAWIISTKR